MLSSTVKRREFPNPQFCGRKRQVLCRPFTRGGRATVRLTKVLLPTGGKSGEYEEIRERTYTKIFPNGSLLLQNIKEDREGMYMCQATNGIGNPIGRMIQLKVNCKSTLDNCRHLWGLSHRNFIFSSSSPAFRDTVKTSDRQERRPCRAAVRCQR